VSSTLCHEDFGGGGHDRLQFNADGDGGAAQAEPARDSKAEEDATLYCKLIGSLRYMVHTRPDMIFAMGYLSRFM
jgi:hypothetical protein